MLKTIIIIVAVVIVGVLIFAATKPDTFRVQRAASIKAPPEKIFPLIDDLRSMQTWSDLGKSRPGDEKNLSRRGYGQGRRV